MIRRYLVNLPWPQPWPVEALLYLALYAGRRFAWRDVWRVKHEYRD